MMDLPIQQHVNPSRNGNFISTILTLNIFGYLTPTIAAVVDASIQGIAQPLKETHRVSLCVFLGAIIIHYIAFAADKMSQRNQANPSQFWGLIAIISGSLSTISLASTFFTYTVAEIICYIALGCAAIIIVVYQYGSRFMDACRWIYDDILGPFFSKTLKKFQDIYQYLLHRTAVTVGNISEEV
ncbi:uncharacterized protein LOC112499238 [Citrus sinensis]|uniref:uncharacterized protein LOC112499238 n=1 Tax=Citrus sinensis TaxID=2711 RepID=UPI0022790F86|nr:uncharacterized protein LOC112499238 [Citrus sinensis]